VIGATRGQNRPGTVHVETNEEGAKHRPEKASRKPKAHS
jgi:hypothetical protein